MTATTTRIVVYVTSEEEVDDRVEIRCEGCGYGAVVRHIPERCPMCGGGMWSKKDTGGRRRR